MIWQHLLCKATFPGIRARFKKCSTFKLYRHFSPTLFVHFITKVHILHRLVSNCRIALSFSSWIRLTLFSYNTLDRVFLVGDYFCTTSWLPAQKMRGRTLHTLGLSDMRSNSDYCKRQLRSKVAFWQTWALAAASQMSFVSSDNYNCASSFDLLKCTTEWSIKWPSSISEVPFTGVYCTRAMHCSVQAAATSFWQAAKQGVWKTVKSTFESRSRLKDD